MKENAEPATDASPILGFIEQFPWVMIPIGVIFLWIGVGYLWNNKVRVIRTNQGLATASFNNILGRVLRFVFKEDKYPVYIKDAEGNPTSAMKYPKYGKFIVWRNLYFIGFATSFLLAILGNEASTWIFGGTILFIATRTGKVFNDRHRVLTRMFEVAASEMGYPREANLNPWGWVQIAEWDNLTIPGQTNVMFPNKYKSDELKNREAFERHFNGTVTDENTWLYSWKSSKSIVVCSPVTHIPEFAPYPGSMNGDWDKIPLGLGTEGEVFWDVSVSPMALVTGTTGGGKASSLLSHVETTDGRKTIGELKVGDTLFDPEGNQTKVTHLHAIITPAKAYEITFSNGEKLIVDPDHLWETETREARLSRFNSVNKEHKRSRSNWLSMESRKAVNDEYEAASNADTISIVEVSKLTGKPPTTNLWYEIAKEIGIAEEVRPQVTLYHKAQIMKQFQTLTYAKSEKVMESYNSRRIVASKKTPLTLNQWDKLRQLSTEVRIDDTLSSDSIVEYLGGNKFTEDWVRGNFEHSLDAQENIKNLYSKGELVKSDLPDKIFSIDSEYVNARQLASLLGVEFSSDFRSMFLRWAKDAESFKKKEEVELIRPERTTVQTGTPYFTYPKKMFLERILRHDDTPMNDQRSKRLSPEIRTTQEIFDTIKSTGATIYTNHSIRKSKALIMNEKELPIKPYSMGAWLGDGDSRRGTVCGIDHQVFENIENNGYNPTEISISTKSRNGHDDFRSVTFPDLSKALKKEGLLDHKDHRVRRDGSTKHVPAIYFSSSIEQRRELLRGLLDTDGSVKDNGAVQFYTSVPQLRDDAKRLIAGLGYIPFVSEKQGVYKVDGEKINDKTTYTITFQADPVDRLFGIDRKNETHKARFNGNNVHSTVDVHYIVDIQEVEPEPMRCISVDSPSRLFLISDSMIATHNSTIQRNIIFHCIQHSDRWRFLGIDVKRVELSPFATYEPTVMGIATDTADGVNIIRYAKDEMEKRYKKMEEHGVNHFKDLPTRMHALMVMVDESYMFLAPSGIKTDDGKEEDALKGEASKLVGDIARLGRAAGVHLVLATQRPDATVIYGELKQNLACRIAAGKADTTASLMTLDNDNATRLPGNIKGRGYVQNFGVGEQFQGYFAPTKWIDKFLSNETAWLERWAKKGQDLDALPMDVNEMDTKKKKAKKPKSKPEESMETPVDTPTKKKGGIMARINAFNEKNADEIEYPTESKIDFSKEVIEDENTGFMDIEESPLLIPAEGNDNQTLNKIAEKLNNTPVEDNSNINPENPFAEGESLEDPFKDLMSEDDSQNVDLFAAPSNEFELSFEPEMDGLFIPVESAFTVEESAFISVTEVDPFADLDYDDFKSDSIPSPGVVEAVSTSPAKSIVMPPKVENKAPALPTTVLKATLPKRPSGLPPRPTRK